MPLGPKNIGIAVLVRNKIHPAIKGLGLNQEVGLPKAIPRRIEFLRINIRKTHPVIEPSKERISGWIDGHQRLVVKHPIGQGQLHAVVPDVPVRVFRIAFVGVGSEVFAKGELLGGCGPGTDGRIRDGTVVGLTDGLRQEKESQQTA